MRAERLIMLLILNNFMSYFSRIFFNSVNENQSLIISINFNVHVVMASNEVPIQEEVKVSEEKSNSSGKDKQEEISVVPSQTPAEIPMQDMKSSENGAFIDEGHQGECIPAISHHDILPELLLRAESKETAPQYSRFG